MIEHREKFIDFVLNSDKDFTRKDVEAGISWLYSRVGLGKPIILIADSYIKEKLMINYVFYRDMVKAGDSVTMNSNSQWKDQIKNINDRRLLDVSVKDWIDIEKQVLKQIGEQATIKTNKDTNSEYKLQFVEQGFGLGFESWVGSYLYFAKNMGVNDEDYKKYVDLLNKGIWSIQYFNEFAFLTKLPRKVTKDEQNRLHSDSEEGAVVWKDGYRNYFIHGVVFDHDLHNKVVNKKLPIRDILALENIEQRYIALELYGAEELFKNLGKDAKLIDKSKRGNALYEIHGLIRGRGGASTGQVVKLMRYIDPSTGREYVSFVPPEIKTADEGMAWKFTITEEKYDTLKIEA